MKLLKLLLISIGTLLVGTNKAENVSEEKAHQIACTFYDRLKNSDGFRSESVSLSLVHKGESALRSATSDYGFYVFNDEYSPGFVIVSGDDRAFPILGYSEEDHFNEEDISPSLLSWLGRYQEQIDFLRNENMNVPSDPLWDVLLRVETFTPEVIISPLCQSLWNQQSPYNYSCPKEDGKNMMLGCVALAMGTVMRYHEWPIHGYGRKVYRWAGVVHDVDFSNTTYEWENMRDSYHNAKGDMIGNNKECTAVAKLLYHCGVSLESKYRLSETSAAAHAPVAALRTYFGYDESVELKERSAYSAGEWRKLIRKELDEKRPIIYNGQGPEGGHAFVCDGYTNADMYHINWGWRGKGNGYFLLDALYIPNDFYYSDNQQIIVNIKKPEYDGKKYSDLLITNNFGGVGITMDTKNVVTDIPFNVEIASIVHRGDTAFNGQIAIATTNEYQQLKEILYSIDIEDLQYVQHLQRLKFPCVVTKRMYNNEQIHVVSTTDDGKTYQFVKGGLDVTDMLLIQNHNLHYCAVTWDTRTNVSVRPVTSVNPDLNRVIYGQDYSFTTSSSPDLLSVKANGIRIKPEYDGSFLIPSVKEDMLIEVARSGSVTDVTGISLDTNLLELSEGETVELQTIITPANASNKKIIWSTSNDAIVSVADGKVTALSPGSATVYATTFDGRITSWCRVIVNQAWVAIESVSSDVADLYVKGEHLFLYTPYSDKIDCYSLSGKFLRTIQKPSGEITLPLSDFPEKALLFRGESGWIRKIVW